MTKRTGPFCGSKLRKGDGTCTQSPGWGTPHPGIGRCKLHGGSTSDQIVHVVRNTYSTRRDISYSEAVLEEVQYTAGQVEWLRRKVAELEPDELVWGVAERAERNATEFAGTDEISRADLNTWVRWYMSERKHLLDACKTAAAIGVEERLVRLAEQGGARLAGLFSAFLDRLGASEEQRRLAITVVPELLRDAAGGDSNAG